MKYANDRERVLRHVRKSRVTGCWNWQRAKIPKGYGLLHHRGRMVYAHRLAHELLVGPIPAGLWVLHRCDNPSCCNPEHLYLGTVHDNCRDKMERGRHRPARGTKQPAAKLTERKVLRARRSYAAGKATQAELAKRYGVSQPVMWMAIHGRTWKHVPLT